MTNIYDTQQSKDYYLSLHEKSDARDVMEEAQALFVSCYKAFKNKCDRYDKASMAYDIERDRCDSERDDSSSVVEKIS